MEYQLKLATPEIRPIVYQLWIYDDLIVDNGTVVLGGKEVKQKININSNNRQDILQHISLEDWQNGKAVVVGIKNFRPGDIEIVQVESTSIMVYLPNNKKVMFTADEYTGNLPNITVSQDVINDLMIKSGGEISIESIIDGVLKTWQ